MAEIQAADRGRGRHGEGFRQLHPGVGPGVQQAEQGRLFRVVGLGRIAGGGADALILLFDQILNRGLFVGGVAP